MPKIFQEMDPEVALKMIEGYENELDPAAKVQEAFYRQFVCPRCGGKCQKHFLGPNHAFGDPDSLVPRSGLKCLACDCVFDPHSNLIVSLGNVGNIPERVVPTQRRWFGGEEE